jgi:hypothetical protein
MRVGEELPKERLSSPTTVRSGDDEWHTPGPPGKTATSS